MIKKSKLDYIPNMEEETRFILFCGHSGKYGFLSNWYPSSFTLNNITFACVEQAMMYGKAILMGDKESARLILTTMDPKRMKALGRQVKNYDDKLWNQHRERVVTEAILAKFEQNVDLKIKLIGTGKDILVEAAHYDKIWGIGMSESHPDSRTPEKWLGLNLLGKCLMTARSQLK